MISCPQLFVSWGGQKRQSRLGLFADSVWKPVLRREKLSVRMWTDFCLVWTRLACPVVLELLRESEQSRDALSVPWRRRLA